MIANPDRSDSGLTALRGSRATVVAVLVVAVLAGCSAPASGERPPAAARAGSSLTTKNTPTTAPASTGPETVAGDADALEVPALAPATSLPAGERPVRIAIPAIGVDSSLVDLGINRDGTLEVPADYRRAGWLDRSAAPGRQGPAIIAGHVDSKSGPAVFYRLAELKPGMKITVTTAAGTKTSFQVDSVKRYAQKHFPTATVYGPVPGPVLRLITCGGRFDRQAGHYRDNVVVYAS